LIIDDANKQAGDIISKALHDSKDKRDEANEFYELRIKQANDDANYEINQAHKKAAKIVATADYYEAERKRGMHSAENDRYAAKVALEEAEKRAANIILDAKERSDVISDATDDTIDEILMDAQTKADHIIHDAKEKAKTIVDQGNETDSYHAKEAGRDADSTIQRAREQANTIVTNAKTEAEKLLEEFRTKGNKALDDARDEVADILNKAKLLSRISKKAPC